MGIFKPWTDIYIRNYYQLRYGPSWLWYWLNYEHNGEFIP